MSTLRVEDPSVKAESAMLAMLRSIATCRGRVETVLSGDHDDWRSDDLQALLWQLNNFISMLAPMAPVSVMMRFEAGEGSVHAQAAMRLQAGQPLTRRMRRTLGLADRPPQNKDLLV